MNILKVEIEGLRYEPFYGPFKESYARRLPNRKLLEKMKSDVLVGELLEIKKRYSGIHRIEFIIEVIEEPVPCKGEIDSKLIREVEEEYRKKKRGKNADKH